MPGRVFLVGGGPGDPGLLTLRAVEVLREADVVLADQLAPREALGRVREGCEVIDVGKVGGGPQVPQEETNRLLIEHARAGRTVVRLKGGDPFVFGRGGEEAQLLREAGVPFEVVPGVTAGIAAPAYAGIPVTQRGLAPAVAFVTAHEDPSKPDQQVDWAALAAFPGTLVLYMGVRALPRIVEQLTAHGRPASQPAAVVSRGTLAAQEAVRAPLGELEAAATGMRAPAIIVVGDVCALGDELAWLSEARPLLGRRIVVTRAQARAGALAGRLRALGADVVEAPAIATESLDVALPADLRGFDLVTLASPTGVERLFALLRERGDDARALAGTRIAVVGPGTADALRARGIEPDVVPGRFVAEGVLDAVDESGSAPRSALVVRPEDARGVLEAGLRERGAEVAELVVYRTVLQPLDDATRERVAAADTVTFTAGSTVRGFLAAASPPDGALLASIGPATSQALREAGLEPGLEAAEHTPDGLVDALVREARERR